MIELIKHIEYLLLENDCVTVPELGGFIAHYQSARYVEEEGLFLPPVRTIGFNPQLCMNDGLLAQSYMQSYHTDFPDATRRINDAVYELKEILFSEGVIDLHGVGTLNYNIHGQYEFQPSECGALSPALYGLSSFSFPLLADETSDALPEIQMPAMDEEAHDEHKIIRMIPRWMGHVAAVVIGFVLFFALSTPVENTYVDFGSYASLGSDCLFDEIRDYSVATSLPALADKSEQVVKAVKTEVVKPVAVRNEVVKPVEKAVTPSTVDAQPEKPIVNEIKQESVKETKAPIKKYHIIVSSLATSDDAERMLKKYHNDGYTDACIKEGNGRFRIALCSYADNADAYKRLNELKLNDSFKDAWLLTSK